MTNMILSLHKCIQSLTKKQVRKELNNKAQKIDTRQFIDYFAHLKDMGYNISYNTRSINMSKSSFLQFDTDGIKDELIPILVMINSKYKVIRVYKPEFFTSGNQYNKSFKYVGH